MMYHWPTCELTGSMLPGCKEHELEASLEARQQVPLDVFCYPQVATWRDRVWRMLSDVITHEVRAQFARQPPDYIVSDDLGWLDSMVFTVTGQLVDVKELMAARLPQEFRAFRAGHATRTNDVTQFYEKGLRRLRTEEIEERARGLFFTDQFSDVAEGRLQAAIKELNANDLARGRRGRLYFCADERELTTRDGGCGHYLVYGSEYLYCLGIRLMSTSLTKRALKSIGRPTMFVCDIPMTHLQIHSLREFSGLIVEYLFCELLEGMTSYALSPGAGSALSLTRDLPGEHIVGHYHPVTVYDPL